VLETTTLLAPLFWPTLYTSVVATDRTPSVGSRVFAHLVGRDAVPTQDMAFTPTRFLHCAMGDRTYGQMGSADPPGKMDEKLKSENMQKKSSFLSLCYILRAIGAGRCRERRYADHIFIQIYFRMHHFVAKFSQISSPQAARGH